MSRQGRALLADLLRQEPERRLTVSAALKHPWVAAVTAQYSCDANRLGVVDARDAVPLLPLA